MACPTLAIVLDEVVVLFVSVVAMAFVTTPFALFVIATLIPIHENNKTAKMIASVIHSPLCDFFGGCGSRFVRWVLLLVLWVIIRRRLTQLFLLYDTPSSDACYIMA